MLWNGWRLKVINSYVDYVVVDDDGDGYDDHDDDCGNDVDADIYINVHNDENSDGYDSGGSHHDDVYEW